MARKSVNAISKKQRNKFDDCVVYCSDAGLMTVFVTANDLSKLFDAIDYISTNTKERPMSDSSKVYYNPYLADSYLRYITFGFNEDGTLYIDVEMSHNAGVVRYEFGHEFWNSSKVKNIDTSIKATIPISNLQSFTESRVFKSEMKRKGGMFVIQYINGNLLAGDSNGNNKFLIECKHGIYALRPDIMPLTDKDFTDDNTVCKIRFPYSAMCGPLMEFLTDYNSSDMIRLTVTDFGTMYMEADNISEKRIMDITKLESMYLASNVAYIRYREFPEVWNTKESELSFAYMYNGMRHLMKHGESIYLDPSVVTLYLRDDGVAMFRMSLGDCVSYSTLYSTHVRNTLIDNVKKYVTICTNAPIDDLLEV